jgi:23S rRNA pseudouridine2605 synthase
MASPKKKKIVTKKPVTKKIAKSKKTAPLKSESTEPEIAAALQAEVLKIEDPIGDETDGEAEVAIKAGTEAESENEPEATEPEFTPAPGAPADGSSSMGWKPRPPAKLERLQKILAAAGVASRRSAEGMIEQGRVQVNGKVVTVLGTKADAARDHIRVDGKLLQGPERHRYFVLNKPRGFVTTVKDPEGRPTVMQFFDKMKERLYPVGRLDFMSEGLLVVTNDGELANRLTKASSGVEKTYLVKVAGQPTEAELNILRGGVAIERGKPGSPQVRTSPARIRQVRQGDNPWYEVVLIEGRNRELRKMFEEVGHFVEKIRRVGYGPLVLDQEPGSLRELQPEELTALRKAAEGTLRTPKSKELRRRNLLDAGLLPTVLPKPSSRPHTVKPLDGIAPAADRPSDFRPKKFGPGQDRDRTSRPAGSFASGAANKLFRPARPSDFSPKKFGAERDRDRTSRPSRPAGSFDKSAGKPFRPAWKKDDRPTRPPARFAVDSTGENRPGAGRPFTARPAWKKPERPAPNRSGPARPEYKRPAAPRREAPVREARVFDEDLGPVRPPNLHIEEISGPDRPSMTRPSTTRPGAPRSSYNRPGFARLDAAKPFRGKSEAPTDRSSSGGWKPGAPMGRSSSGGWKGGQSRPFSTSSGKPRAGGARPSSKSGPGWKPKPGGFSKSGYKAKPGSPGPKRSGPRPFDNRPGGKRTGGFSGKKKHS